ncbi:MAG: methyltransferase domain-containing protein [Oliverpabstia sp.]|nr:methyltransferase domain-containing protein [Oliverpabstia sp.]
MKENKNETRWERFLQIRTMGRDDSNADQYRYPYEPTPYSVLERLANTGLIRKDNTLLDYGCGKGRIDFFLSYQTRCQSIGIEYDERIYEKAIENKETAISSGRVTIELTNAENFIVSEIVDRIYFFNPFSVEILQKVISRIVDSYYENMRFIQLFFYYPSDEYITYLMTVDELIFADEIDCQDLFPGNDSREKIVVFEMGELQVRENEKRKIVK